MVLYNKIIISFKMQSYFDYKNGIRKTHEQMSSQEFKIFAEMCFKFKSNNKTLQHFLTKRKRKTN